MSLSDHGDHVALLGVGHRIFDGLTAIRNLDIVSAGRDEGGLDIRDDVRRLLIPGIIRRENAEIRELGRCLPHAVTTVLRTVATAAEDHDEALRLQLPQGT